MTMQDRAIPFARGRFAPSTTGLAHPGTLIAALLCWLDARAAGAEVWLRLEDLDRDRTKPGYVDRLRRDLEWFGLEWDACHRQSEANTRHETALDRLVDEGRVYACDCSRSSIRRGARRAPDGSHVYPGTCRGQWVSPGGWRSERRPLRYALDGSRVEVADEGGVDLSGVAGELFGDPLLRRRDGALTYHFVSVLDDAASGVDRVVRGRDLMPSTTIQVALQHALGLSTPRYRHHCLFLERRGGKLSKLHGAVDVEALRSRYDAEELCGRLAAWVGLVSPGTRCRPADLVSGFDWGRVTANDVALAWSRESGLVTEGPKT
jgi:glutamyl-tRNA synthetase/glutamyl-Q tRNA(Asp) synthetase